MNLKTLVLRQGVNNLLLQEQESVRSATYNKMSRILLSVLVCDN